MGQGWRFDDGVRRCEAAGIKAVYSAALNTNLFETAEEGGMNSFPFASFSTMGCFCRPEHYYHYTPPLDGILYSLYIGHPVYIGSHWPDFANTLTVLESCGV